LIMFFFLLSSPATPRPPPPPPPPLPPPAPVCPGVFPRTKPPPPPQLVRLFVCLVIRRRAFLLLRSLPPPYQFFFRISVRLIQSQNWIVAPSPVCLSPLFWVCLPGVPVTREVTGFCFEEFGPSSPPLFGISQLMVTLSPFSFFHQLSMKLPACVLPLNLLRTPCSSHFCDLFFFLFLDIPRFSFSKRSIVLPLLVFLFPRFKPLPFLPSHMSLNFFFRRHSLFF